MLTLCDIQQQLNESFKNYLNQNSFSFLELKNLIVNKSSILTVQQIICNIILEAKAKEILLQKSSGLEDIERIDKFEYYITAAEELNYIVFLRQLKVHLKNSKLALQKIEALREILRLIDLHLQQKEKIITIKSNLDHLENINSTLVYSLIQTMENDEITLNHLIPNYELLNQDNSNLLQTNKRIKNLNNSLPSLIYEQKKEARSSGILVVIGFVGTIVSVLIPLIPLIMTAPPIAIIPLATIPLIPFLMMLYFGILAIRELVDSIKMSAELKSNQEIINSNNNQLIQNNGDIQDLKFKTIHDLNDQIKMIELQQERLKNMLQTAQNLEKQTLAQATEVEIKPIIQPNTPLLFKTENNVHQLSSVSPTEGSRNRLETSNAKQ